MCRENGKLREWKTEVEANLAVKVGISDVFIAEVFQSCESRISDSWVSGTG